jgi:hypothetical protein
LGIFLCGSLVSVKLLDCRYFVRYSVQKTTNEVQDAKAKG